jgi:hypothetical protein
MKRGRHSFFIDQSFNAVAGEKLSFAMTKCNMSAPDYDAMVSVLRERGHAGAAANRLGRLRRIEREKLPTHKSNHIRFSVSPRISPISMSSLSKLSKLFRHV